MPELELGHRWRRVLWPEVVAVDRNILPFDQYQRIAICRLSKQEKDKLRRWAEYEKPSQAALRQRIREEVGRLDGIHRQDFENHAAA